MSEIPLATPEKNEAIDDNARKFTLDGLAPAFLDGNNADSYVMTTDWLVTDENSEEKLVYKKFKNDEVKILLIKKVMDENGKRKSVKKEIPQEKYEELKTTSILQVEKTRYEFSHSQNGTDFSLKYDEFTNSELRVLEVDAEDDNGRELFDKTTFAAGLTEVTGNLDFYGYRVAALI